MYTRRQPEGETLHRLVREHLHTLYTAVKHGFEGASLPDFVRADLEGYVTCGALNRGFAHLSCEGCRRPLLVAFSCSSPAIGPGDVISVLGLSSVAPKVECPHSSEPAVRWRLSKTALETAAVLLTSAALARKGGKPGKKSEPVFTKNALKAKGKTIMFTCSPANCREQQGGSLVFNLSCKTDKEGDKLEISAGDKSQTVQGYGFTDIPGELKAPKKGSVPIKLTVSEDEGSPQSMFTFSYTADQVRRTSCHKYGDVEL